MKAVTQNPFLAQGPGQGVAASDERLAGMKTGVEAGHLWHVRRGDREGADGCQIVLLMERGQRHEGLEVGQHCRIDTLRRQMAECRRAPRDVRRH